MKYHDYACPRGDCPERVFDVVIGEEELAKELRGDGPAVPACPVHGDLMEVTYLPRGSRPFAAFDYEGEDGKTVTVSSLEQLRKIEHDSVERWKRGEGRPEIFRNYSQDSSNRNDNVFKRLHPQYNQGRVQTRNRRGVPFVTSVAGPAVPYNPDEE
jgi:hypothetical protein